MFHSFNVEPQIEVRNVGYVPFSLFSQDPLNLPGGFAWDLLGHGSRYHAPDEYFVIEGNNRIFGLADCEKGFAKIILNYGASNKTHPLT